VTAPDRLRFSPAPTGFLHIGSVRTALFNWLQARHTGATFILRIEDTDVARSTQESTDQIQHVMQWCGLDWDEGPYLQSLRFDEYLAAAQTLLDAGVAYECFCTEDEVKARNEDAMRAGRTPGYDGRCRDLTAEQRAAARAEGKPRSVRFRTPDEGRSSFEDLVRGEVSVEWATVPDFVIVRSNGTPVFFLANAVDDAAMQITHVLRGEDLIDSTHRVLALRRALGHTELPRYAHLPLIIGPGGGKLSKRHGAVSVEEYRDAGYLPHALVNYLALLGWGPEDGREVLTIDELIAEFDVSRVNPSSATNKTVPSRAANTFNWSTRTRADWRIASSGVMTPLVSMLMISLSRSVRCSTRADSTAYDTRRTGENDASRMMRPMVLFVSSDRRRTLPGT